jgi:hypothetical protein
MGVRVANAIQGRWMRASITLVLSVAALVASHAVEAHSASPARRPAHAIAARQTIWVPAPHTTWQWQLTTPVDRSTPAQMFDIDLFDNSAGVVAALHRSRRHVVCYLDAGTYENFRPDAHLFPKSVLGKPNGWPGERWLDIRRLSILEPIMRARIALCARKGFDGVEADNVDGYENPTGFPLTGAQQLTYNEWLARTAHALHLSIALKNDVDQTRQLEPHFDYALDEQCFQYTECQKLRPFVAHHKAVFEVEYQLPTSRFCAQANRDGFMSMRTDLNLDGKRQECWR